MILDRLNTMIHHSNSCIHILSHNKLYKNKTKFIKIHIMNIYIKTKTLFSYGKSLN